jgi:hypothetical protein
VILVRGCKDVELEAVTSPVNQPVTWQVRATENSESPPSITPEDGGRKAKLKTDKTGSFSVIATLNSSKVVWNVVFVWVKVDVSTSVVLTRDDRYADAGSSAIFTSFQSGTFPGLASSDQYALWAKVEKVELIGGGSAKSLGVDKVKLHILQNGIADSLTGNYSKGGTAREVPKGGLPVVDATDASSPFITIAGVTVDVQPDNTSAKRSITTGDSPAGAFPVKHKNDASQVLQSISGSNDFLTAIASTSDDAPNAIVVHAQLSWKANFKGKVDASGIYTSDGARTSADSRFALISEATGGQDACDAGYETFEPRFNGGTDTTWHP